MRTLYHLGRSGHGAFLTSDSIASIARVAPAMPPGQYWITTTRRGRSAAGTAWEESEDWGTLTVRDTDDWALESLDGCLRAGPGYLGVTEA